VHSLWTYEKSRLNGTSDQMSARDKAKKGITVAPPGRRRRSYAFDSHNRSVQFFRTTPFGRWFTVRKLAMPDCAKRNLGRNSATCLSMDAIVSLHRRPISLCMEASLLRTIQPRWPLPHVVLPLACHLAGQGRLLQPRSISGPTPPRRPRVFR
jgi:hypothetical protein